MKRTPVRTLPVFVMAVLIAAGSGCASAPKDDSGARRAPAPSYAETKRKVETGNLVAPGFILNIEHAADPKISGKYEVEFDGQIKMPYKVSVTAAGLTPSQLEGEIERKYRSYYRTNNSVEVDISERKYMVEVRGLVQKPGRYSVRIDTSLEELVAMAGGFPGTGADANKAGSPKPEYLRIVRNNFDKAESSTTRWFDLANYFYNYDTDADFLWRGGEAIYFLATTDSKAPIKRKWNTVLVMGEVNTPGEVAIVPGADIYQYMAKAGGPKTGADTERVLILHRGADERDTVNLRTDIGFSDIQEGDVILVEAKDVTPSTFEKALTYTAQVTGIVLSLFLIVWTF